MYLLVGLSESWKSNTRFLHLYRGLRGRLFFCLSSWSDSQQRADEGPLSLLNIPWLTQMVSLTRCGPHDSTITRSSGRGGVDVGGVAEGKRRRWRCSLFHISSAVDFFINHPTSTPPPQLTPPLPFLLHHHLPLETYRGRCSANPECWAEITGCCCVCVRHTELKVYTHLRHSRYTAWVFQELQTLNQHDKTNQSSYFKTTRKAL